jgi:GNAT superfamily N-acetyltransferase
MLTLAAGQTITTKDFEHDDSVRADINKLFHSHLNVGLHGIPTRAEEDSTAAMVPGFPEEIIVSARHSDRLVGALLMNVATTRYAQMVSQLGSPDAALLHATRWRTLNRMVVIPEFRGQGIGTQMLERAKLMAKLSGARGFDGFAEDSPNPSWPFYARNGCHVMGEGDPLPPLGGVQMHMPPGVNREGRYFWSRIS